MSVLRSVIAILLLSACAGCSGGARYAAHWDGRRGYDGNGDYGYDLAASRAEAQSYGVRAAPNYPAPGTPDDPWGPYIREAASRFQVPERWIREVMRQESGGRLQDGDGSPITSSAGAMGLMQVMPRTYEILQQRYGLGGDPYAPRDNILAGAAYIHEMYAIYGSPGFLAAYNAGPDRLDAYLSGGTPLPDETVNYVASIAPRLGTEVAMSGALAVFAGGAASGVRPASTQDADRAYAGGGMVGRDDAASNQMAAATDDPSARAFDGGGLVTPDAPTGVFSGQAAPVPVVATASLLGPSGQSLPRAASVAMLLPVAATATPRDSWGIQVGAFPDPATSQAATAAAMARAQEYLAGTQPVVIPVQRAGMLYRARLVGLSAERAGAACSKLSREGMDCFTVPPGS